MSLPSTNAGCLPSLAQRTGGGKEKGARVSQGAWPRKGEGIKEGFLLVAA